jgi:hypothetical protein
MEICGVAPDLPERKREAVATVLEVELLLLREGAQVISTAPGFCGRGQAVRAVLERVSEEPCVLARLLVSGRVVGLWGAPYAWDRATAQLRRVSFHDLGTDPP